MRRRTLRAALEAIPSSGSPARLLGPISSKRTAHGSSAWSIPQADHRLAQPQDGAAEVSKVTGYGNEGDRVPQSPASEPEDARITGGTRSLMRRVMGLNVAKAPAALRPARVIPPTVRTQIA